MHVFISMEELVTVLVTLLSVLLPLGIAVGCIIMGHFTEKWHLQSLRERESGYPRSAVSQVKTFPNIQPGSQTPQLVVAEVVIASDYWKTFWAGWVNFFGGEMRGYQKMIDRARREAVLRLLEQAEEKGFNAICNVRIDTADITGASTAPAKRAASMACVLASATAYMTS
ncbi:MAG: heavy metal-binding domain-containing protein [Planctomycetaceae bacterium]|nr:heavy metal-binding domain-containing protein [Planctomycetaceae bacterium]MCA9042838.1 heavy metal-binding domain-containing protein [Planctomycetaceae bacterium]MCB9950599.1 heavy metal-binding domain-containing protein [Planctomycetaceae bacterium]